MLQYRTSEPEVSRDIANIASFFPPLYIGQTVDLRDRFHDHTTGTNGSRLLKDLNDNQLSRHMSFFHWHQCTTDQLQEFESILIQANLPVFNRTLNQNW